MQVTKVDVRTMWGKKTRVYVFPQGETLLENLANRKSRPYTAYRKEVLPAVFRAMGLPENTRAKWSQYAGCSCPCSPGFVLDVYGKEVFVNVEA